MTRKNFMKRIMISALSIPLALCASQSQAGNVGVDIHFGIPFQPEIIVQRPVYRRPVPTFYFRETPDFIYQESLGFSVGVGSPYDVFYDNNDYYIFQQGYWHRSSQLDGPWRIVDYQTLPPNFRRHKIEQIRRYRDAEYNTYRQHRRYSPDRRYTPRYSREYRDRDHRNYRQVRDHREERRPRDHERRERW